MTSKINLNRSYDDMQVTVSTARVPASNAPAWTTWNYGIGGGIEFAVLAWEIDDYFDFIVQSSHAMELSSILDNHIHFSFPTESAGSKIRWRLDVVAAAIGASFAVPAGSPFTSLDYTMTAAEVGKHRLLAIGDIPGINTTVSTLYQCRLTRVAATNTDYAGVVYLLFTDCHYVKDSLGSMLEDTK